MRTSEHAPAMMRPSGRASAPMRVIDRLKENKWLLAR
jgi:hypothetical protein